MIKDNQRLHQNNILKLEDELLIQEAKIVWKWDKKRIPKSLQPVIEEKTDRLRNRRFKTIRNMKTNSINSRLAKIANNSMTLIASNKSTKSLSQSLKKRALDSYNLACRSRNCFICAHRNV